MQSVLAPSAAGALLLARSDVERLLAPEARVHAELGEVVAGLNPGRSSDSEITVFDSTGTALLDVAAAIAVYRRALASGEGTRISFNG